MPVSADTKNFRGVTYYHEEGESFASKEEARIHAESLKRRHSFIRHVRVVERPNGAYWVWWSYH